MGLEVPDWAAKTFLVLTGESWPEADEDGLRRLSGAWETFASRLDGAEHDIASAGHAVHASWLGQGSDAFSSTMDRLTGSDALPQIRSGSRKLGFYAEASAVNVEYTKYSIIGQLVILAIEIASLVPYLFFPPTAPAAAGAIAALKALGQWIARNLFRRLLYSLMWNLVTQVGLDVIIQAIQMGKGSRKEWNTMATLGAFTSGVVGTILGEVIGRVGTKVLGAKMMETFLAHVVTGGFHEWTTEAITNLIFNSPRPPTVFSATAGAAEGAIDGLGRRSRGTFARGLPGGVDIGPIEVSGLVDGDLTLEGTFTTNGGFDGVARINGTFAPADGSPAVQGTFLGRLTANDGSLTAADQARSSFIGMRMDPATSFGQLKTTGTLAADFVFNGQFSPSAPASMTSAQTSATSTEPAGSRIVELADSDSTSLWADSASVTSQGTTLVDTDTASIASRTITPASTIGAPTDGSVSTATDGSATVPTTSPAAPASTTATPAPTGEAGPARWSSIPELVGQNLTPDDLAYLWHRYPGLQELPVPEVAQMLRTDVLTKHWITDYLPSHDPGRLLGGSEQPAPPPDSDNTTPPTIPTHQVISPQGQQTPLASVGGNQQQTATASSPTQAFEAPAAEHASAPHGMTESPPDTTVAPSASHHPAHSQSDTTASSAMPTPSPSDATPLSGPPAPSPYAPLAHAGQHSQQAYDNVIRQRRDARADAEGRLAFLRHLVVDQPRLPVSNAEYQARLEQLRKVDVTDQQQLGELAFWRKMAETIRPAPDSPARARARQEVEQWSQALGLQPDPALAGRAATIAYAQEIRQAANEASEAADTARQEVLNSPHQQSSMRFRLILPGPREFMLGQIAWASALVDASKAVNAGTSSRMDTAAEHGRQARQDSVERQLSQGPPPDDARSAEEARIQAWQEAIGEGFRVPSWNDSGKGKGPAIQWYRVQPHHPQGSPVRAYDVSDSGWLRLRNGQMIPPGGWIRVGDSLVHPAAQAVFRPDTGRITRADDATLASVQTPDIAPLTITADLLGLRISPDHRGPSEFLALEVRPHRGDPTPAPAWTRPTTGSEATMIEEAGRNTERHTSTSTAANNASAEAYMRHIVEHVPTQEAIDRHTDDLGRRIERAFDPNTPVEVQDEIVVELAEAERIARYVEANLEPMQQRAQDESAHMLNAEQREEMASVNHLRYVAEGWGHAAHEAMPEADTESFVDALWESRGTEDSRRDLINRLATARAMIDIGTDIEASHEAADEAGNEAAQQIRDTLRQSAEQAAEWRLRHQGALTEFFGDQPRLLPPGFGEVEPATGRRRFALGHHGRLLWAGDPSLTSEEAVAGAVVEALPDEATAELREAVHDRVVEILTTYDPRIFVQSMLEGGTPITVAADGKRHRVVAKLDLGDLNQAEYVPLAHAERTPPGEEWHVLVNADHEVQSFTRRSVANSRKAALSVGSPPWKFFQEHLEVTAGGGINATSGTTYSQGFDEVSATKRYLEVSGIPAHFDFGDASLSTEVTVVGSTSPASTGSAERTIRAEFPRELAPLRSDDAHGVQPSTADALGDKLGVDPSTLKGDVAEARRRADNGRPLTAEQRRLLALHGVLSYVFHLPESAPGLGGLREQIRQIVDGGPQALTDDAVRDIDWWVSEPAFLRMFSDITGSGAPSPLIPNGEHGFHVTLRATVLNAQAVSTDPVPLKEESQRFASDHNDVTDSGGVGVEVKAKAKGSFGDGKADTGFSGGVDAEVNVGAGHNAARSLQPNSGSGEVRGLVYNGDSVRYRVAMNVGAEVAANLPGVPSTTPASDVIDVYIRVPVEQRSRFEAMLEHIMANEHATPHQAYESTLEPGPPTVLSERQRGKLPEGVDPGSSMAHRQQSTADPEQSVKRYPPASITAGKSMGFTAMERLAQAENVLPTALRLLKRLESTMVGPKPPDSLAQTALVRQLGSKLTREALTNAGTQLFQRGGVPIRVTMPGKGGVEHVTVRVTAQRQPHPRDSGRVAKTKLELMPAGFAGLSGDDNLSGTTSAGFKIGGDLQHNKSKWGLGLGFKIGGAWTRNHGTNVSSSGFQLQAMLYEGPARTFDYDLTYNVSVTVKMKRRLVDHPVVWAKAVGRLLSGRPRPTLSTTQTATDSHPGSARLVLPEPLAPKEEPTADEIGDTGAVEVFTTDRLDEVTTMLAGEQGHAPINADDVLTDLIGGPDLAAQIQAILDAHGISATEAEQLTMWSTDQTQLEGMHIRGPSSLQPALVLKGTFSDTHVDVLLESFPVKLREKDERISFMKMDVAEGGGSVSAFKGKKKAVTWGLTLGPKATFGEYSGSLPTSANWGTATEWGKGKGLGPQTGRLTQLPNEYRRNVADAIWRISVTSREKNLAGTYGNAFDHVFVRVRNGIEFLRPVTPAQPPTQPDDPIPMEQTTTTTTFPERLTKIPVTAASERLLSPPSTRDPTGSKNVMLDVVTDLLGKRAKGYLKRKWTIEGMTDVPPRRLTGILNPGSATAMTDLLLGPGLILHTTRSLPLLHERVVIMLRAQRDPQGYKFREEVNGANVSRYNFRHNTTTTSTTKTKSQDAGTVFSTAQSGFLPQALKSISESLGLKFTSSRSKGHALTVTDATRDTLFIPGLHGRYYGEMTLIGEITRVRAPSRLLNLLTANLAKLAMRRYYKDQKPGEASDVFTERVLVPKGLTLPDIEPSPEPGATVENWPPLSPPASRPLPLTPQDLLTRRVINLGFDPAKLKVLSDRVLSHLSKAGTPVNLLASPGTRSRDAVNHMFSFPMFTRELEFMLGPNGLDSPNLVSDGGPVTDNHGIATVRVELAGPRKLEFIKGWLEWANYGFTEHKQDLGGSQGVGLDANVTFDPGFAITGGLSLSQSTSYTNSGVLKSMWPTTGYLRQVPWLRVSAEAIVHVTVKARNKRGWLAYGGNRTVASFRVPDALELAFGPEASLRHGLLHPHGMPTPAGFYMPSRDAVTDPSSPDAVRRQAEELHGSFSFPPVKDAVVLHVTTQLDETGTVRFEVNENLLTTAEFHHDVLQHLELDGETIVLVGSHGATPDSGGSTAAAELARHTGKTVVAANGPVHTTSDGHVLAATPGANNFGQPLLVSSRHWLRVTPDGHTQTSQAFELVESLRQWGFGVPELSKPVLPPKAPVLWGQPADGRHVETGHESGEAPSSREDSLAEDSRAATPPPQDNGNPELDLDEPHTSGSDAPTPPVPVQERIADRLSPPPAPQLPSLPVTPEDHKRLAHLDLATPLERAPASPGDQRKLAHLDLATPQTLKRPTAPAPVQETTIADLLSPPPAPPTPTGQSAPDDHKKLGGRDLATPPVPAEQTTVQSRRSSMEEPIARLLSPAPAAHAPTIHSAPPSPNPRTTQDPDRDNATLRDILEPGRRHSQ